MKHLFTILFVFLSIHGFCQSKVESKDTVIVDPWFLFANSATWNNWFYDNKIEVGRKVVCYYDKDHKYKLFEGVKTSDSVLHSFNWKIFYLNGQIKESYDFDLSFGKVAPPIIREYFFNGELKGESFDGYINYPIVGRTWGYNYNGVRSLTQEIFNGKRIEYDIYNGDTLSVGYKDTSGKYVYLSYVQNQLVYKGGCPQSSQWFSYPPAKQRGLTINLDSNMVVLPRGSGPSYRPQHLDLVHERNKLDSLKSYKNIVSLAISINDPKDLPHVLKKMAILPSFEELREIRIIGAGFIEIPDVVFRCKKLHCLEIINTNITQVPEKIECLKKLTYFNVTNYNPDFDYSMMMSRLAQLPNLKTLCLPWNYDVPLPDGLAHLNHLKTLIMGDRDNGPKDYWDFDPLTMTYDTIVQKHNFEILGKLDSLVTLMLCNGTSLGKYIVDHRLDNPSLNCEFYATCFPAETQILMANGSSKSIESICVGDEIISFDETTQEMDTSRVNQVHIYKTNAPEFIKIHFTSTDKKITGEVSATAEHPFYCNGQWTKAQDLQIGQELRVVDRGFLTTMLITDLETIVLPGTGLIYNLNTTSHTFVANGVVVHNK